MFFPLQTYKFLIIIVCYDDLERDYLSIELKGMRGKEALFKIQIDGNAKGRSTRSFPVRKVWSDFDQEV